MIINTKTLSGLIQKNVSVDNEKTKLRVKELWSASPGDARKQALAIAKASAGTIYRIFKMGTITPRISLALAHSLDADPFYLTGDADENEGFSQEKLNMFLAAKGIGEPQGGKAGKKAKRSRKAEQAPAPAADAASDAQAAIPDSQEAIDIVSVETAAAEATEETPAMRTTEETLAVPAEIPEEDFLLQLRALYNRSAFSASSKAKLAAIANMLFKD